MRILILHSDVAADAAADEQDTLITARAIELALTARGHAVTCGAFVADMPKLRALLRDAQADMVFDMVESVHGEDILAAIAPALFEKLGVRYTGANATALSVTGDKPFAKALMRHAGLPTAAWANGPDWNGLALDKSYIVKSATADASLGLDDDAVVRGADVPARAAQSAQKFGGRWFAEAYVAGREFNVSLLDDADGLRVLPIAEMRFVNWDEARPQIVGYAAKWDDTNTDSSNTVRAFGLEQSEPALHAALEEAARGAWALFGLSGYARVDFRVTKDGLPMILEINPNPCLEPGAGFAAAAAQANIAYDDLVERIVLAAHRS